MKIALGTAVGQGPTTLAAYDDALQKLGAQDFNIIVLSSVIPQGWTVERTHPRNLPQLATAKRGDRLYVVQAQASTAEIGRTVSAGLGWVRTAGDQGYGLFYEEFGMKSEQEVSERIEVALHQMVERRNMKVAARDCVVVSATCSDEPVCVLALAVYTSEPWQSGSKEKL